MAAGEGVSSSLVLPILGWDCTRRGREEGEVQSRNKISLLEFVIFGEWLVIILFSDMDTSKNSFFLSFFFLAMLGID
jgi:hypothetical protein